MGGPGSGRQGGSGNSVSIKDGSLRLSKTLPNAVTKPQSYLKKADY